MKRYCAVLTCLIFSNFLSVSDATEHPAQVAGIYEGSIAVKNSDARKITLTLGQDGTGEFRDSETKSKIIWSVIGEELQVEVAGKPAAMVWRIKGNSLHLKSAERKDYGKKGLTLRRPR